MSKEEKKRGFFDPIEGFFEPVKFKRFVFPSMEPEKESEKKAVANKESSVPNADSGLGGKGPKDELGAKTHSGASADSIGNRADGTSPAGSGLSAKVELKNPFGPTNSSRSGAVHSAQNDEVASQSGGSSLSLKAQGLGGVGAVVQNPVQNKTGSSPRSEKKDDSTSLLSRAGAAQNNGSYNDAFVGQSAFLADNETRRNNPVKSVGSGNSSIAAKFLDQRSGRISVGDSGSTKPDKLKDSSPNSDRDFGGTFGPSPVFEEFSGGRAKINDQRVGSASAKPSLPGAEGKKLIDQGSEEEQKVDTLKFFTAASQEENSLAQNSLVRRALYGPGEAPKVPNNARQQGNKEMDKHGAAAEQRRPVVEPVLKTGSLLTAGPSHIGEDRCVVVSGEDLNTYSKNVLVVPIERRNSPLPSASTVMLEQDSLLSGKNLARCDKLSFISKDTLRSDHGAVSVRNMELIRGAMRVALSEGEGGRKT